MSATTSRPWTELSFATANEARYPASSAGWICKLLFFSALPRSSPRTYINGTDFLHQGAGDGRFADPGKPENEIKTGIGAFIA